MKVRAIYGRHSGEWNFYLLLPMHSQNYHYLIDDCPEELWERYDNARKEFLAATHELAKQIPSDVRQRVVVRDRWNPPRLEHMR